MTAAVSAQVGVVVGGGLRYAPADVLALDPDRVVVQVADPALLDQAPTSSAVCRLVGPGGQVVAACEVGPDRRGGVASLAFAALDDDDRQRLATWR